jgi:hypothetical protein
MSEQLDTIEQADLHNNEDTTYDIDSPIEMIQANVHHNRPSVRRPSFQSNNRQHNNFQNNPRPPSNFQNNTRLPNDKWSQLNSEDRNTWNSLSRETKAIILGLQPTGNPVPQYHKPFIKDRSSMLHEISAYDLLSSMSETPPETPGSNEDSQDSDTLLAHATSIRRDISPADICKVISSVKTPHKTKEKESCVTIDGKKYRQCNMSQTYHVLNHTRQKDISLVDRGANGGIAGNDVKQSSTCSDKTVKIMGIDNHQLTSIPIITAGRVSKSHVGPVILIFNQYAHHSKGK